MILRHFFPRRSSYVALPFPSCLTAPSFFSLDSPSFCMHFDIFKDFFIEYDSELSGGDHFLTVVVGSIVLIWCTSTMIFTSPVIYLFKSVRIFIKDIQCGLITGFSFFYDQVTTVAYVDSALAKPFSCTSRTNNSLVPSSDSPYPIP